MNIKTTFLSVGAMFFSALAFAQQNEEHTHNGLVCGAPDVHYEDFQATVKEAKKILANRKQTLATTNEPIYIPIQMHLLGDDDGSNRIDENYVNDMLAELNKIYKAGLNMEFFFAGTTFKKYDNTAMNNRGSGTTYAQEIAFNQTNGVKNAINFYVVNSLRGTGGYSYIAPTIQDNNLMMVIKGQVNDNKTTPHEFGHYFGLGHTFNSSNAKDSNGNADWTKRELVTRNFNEVSPRLSANCYNTGDFFCDTPADPYGSDGASSSNCVVSANPDGNGDTFAPHMGNFMNYYFCSPYSFTAEQIAKMKASHLVMNEKTTFFTAPETDQPKPTNLKITSGLYKGTTVLSWDDNSDVETGYIIEMAEEGTDNFIPVGGVATNVNTFTVGAEIDNSKKYIFRVKPSNSKKNYSVNSEVFELPKLCADQGTLTCSSEGIAMIVNNFSLTKDGKTLIANNNSGCSGKRLSDYFETHQAKVNAGDTVAFTAQSRIWSGRFYYTAAKLFCDWNNDGDFDDENELISEQAGLYATAKGTFKIPENLPTGKYRLRIVLSYSSPGATSAPTNMTACNANNGEMEDYALDVSNPTLSATENVVKAGFAIYPNPVSTTLNIQNGEDYTAYEIYDASGRLVKKGNLVGVSINVSDLSNGVYTLRAISKNGDKTSVRFIKGK